MLTLFLCVATQVSLVRTSALTATAPLEPATMLMVGRSVAPVGVPLAIVHLYVIGPSGWVASTISALNVSPGFTTACVVTRNDGSVQLPIAYSSRADALAQVVAFTGCVAVARRRPPLAAELTGVTDTASKTIVLLPSVLGV